VSLEISLLGQIELRLDGRPLPLPATRKAQSLLAYLVTHPGRPHPREQLANLFWPDRPRDKALHNLSTALWHIRRVLPPGNYLLTNTQTVQFNSHNDFWLDVKEFEEAVISDQGSGAGKESLIADPSSLVPAIQLYRGDFLEGFYDDWCLEERYHLEALFLGTLGRLIALHQERDEPETALEYVRWLLLRDPLREDIHRQAMRLHARQGDRAAVLQQYLQCQAVLRDQLGIEPAPETTALCQRLTGEVPRTPLLPVSAPHFGSGHSPLGVIRPQLVERTQDLVTLQAAWERACQGHGHMVLVEGEAGIGKTRLIEEFAAQVRWQGGQIAQGCCYEYDRPLPYCAITEALHNLSGRLPLSALGELPAWMLAEVSRLAPEIGEMQTDLPPSIEEKASLQQTRLLEALTRFLKTISSHLASPLLLVLDDLHWASDSTLTFLQYFAPRLSDAPILLVGAFRGEELTPDHALRRLLRRMKRQGQATGLHLQRLSPVGVMALVQAISGCGDEIFPLAQRLHRETEGNPFFLLETIRALFEAGSLQFQEGRWRADWMELARRASLAIPPGVEALIRARVSRLTPATQEAIALAAATGQNFDFEMLEQAWGRGEEAALLAVEELLRGQVIVEGQGAAARDYAFDHPKVREVVYATTHYRRRRRFHRLIGQAMEVTYRGRPGIARELAHHFERAGETEKALAYLLQAGDAARGLYAYQEAIDYYQRALVLLKEQGEHEGAARTLMRLGLTYHIAFDFHGARRAYEEGFALWQRAGKMQPAILPPALHTLRVDWRNPPTLDPTLAWDTISAGVIDQLFSGLLELSPEMEIVPAVARSWELSEGGRKYVFRLRDDVCWSDGVLVTAEDFEYAWKRVLDPAIGSPGASKLFDVKNARAFHQGQVSDPDRVGIRALDKFTLVVELEEPTSYFPHLLAHHISYPVPRHVVEAHSGAWTEPENIVSDGPFQLEAWQRGESIVLSRNPEYHGQLTGNVQRLELSLLSDWNAKLKMYKTNDLDIFDLWRSRSSEMVHARQQYAGDYVTGPMPVTMYVGFRVSHPPFDDVRVRRAFVHAIDREMLADVVMEGYVFPATDGFVPPGMPGHAAGSGLRYDPDQAWHLLAEAGYPPGSRRRFPPVDLLTFHGGESRSEYLQAQWRENLGIEIGCDSMELGVLLEKLDRDPPSMFLIGWLADYPDPDNFLRVCPAKGWTGWHNEAYTGLVEAARRVTNQGERMRMYRQADRILVEEAAIMPLTYGRRHLLVKPWVKKFPVPVMQTWFWKDVIVEPH
jgi:oligopeptide transport system substrate-binding protein